MIVMTDGISRTTLAGWIERGATFDLVDTLPAQPYARHYLPSAIHTYLLAWIYQADRALRDASAEPWESDA